MKKVDITGIEKREPTEIVSLSIEGDHSYVAGGIIVHNTTVCRAYDGATWDLNKQPIMGNKIAIRNRAAPDISDAGQLRFQL